MSSHLASVGAFARTGGPAASPQVDPRPRRPAEAPVDARGSSSRGPGVVVNISEEARHAAAARAGLGDRQELELGEQASDRETDTPDEPALGPPLSDRDLSEKERQDLAELRQRDQQVRTRDMAYVAATSGVSGGFTVRYQTGPDGRRYAVSADVQFDTSEAATPERSLAKARALRAALMSAGGDAARDASATARAAALEDRARAELAREHRHAEEAHAEDPAPGLPEVVLEGVEDLEEAAAG